MKQVSFLILCIIAVSFNLGCDSQSHQHADKFYDTISRDWDYLCIPVIKPYKAETTDNGRSWLLDLGMINQVMVSKFAVANNIVYGYAKEGTLNGQPTNKHWFAFDTKSEFFAAYSSRQELESLLKEFDMPMNDLVDCQKYMDSVARGHDLSWYKTIGKNTTPYLQSQAKKLVMIKVTEDSKGEPDFYFDPVLPLQKNNVYFFKINYHKQQNDLYYLLLPNRNPILIKDNLVVPVFMDSRQDSVYLYTPVPVAEEKKIPESKRFQKAKLISVQ